MEQKQVGRVAVVLLLAAAGAVAPAQAPQPQYGSWMPLPDGMQNGVDIAFKLYPDGTQYYKLMNTYKVPVSVTCKFSFQTRDGKRQTDSGCSANNLAPGAEAKSMGMFDFGVASVDLSSLSAKVKLLGAPQGGGSTTDSNKGVSGMVGPQDNAIIPNPSREGGSAGAAPGQHYSTGDYGVCHIGEKAGGLPNGEQLLPGVEWEERVTSDANLCPAKTIAGTRIDQLAVYERDTTRYKVIKNGVVTDCTAAAKTQFRRCIPAGEGKNYPRKGFSIHPPTAVIGNTG